MDGIEFQQLVKTFQNVETLPQLPETSIRLIQACEDDNATLQTAEHIVASDPGLAATIIRAASTARFLTAGGPATSVSSAVMRLGLRVLKALAMTYTFRSLMNRRHSSEHYDPKAFAQHSVFVAIATQFMYDRQFGHSGHDLEEVFAFGLLHDLGICLLANVAPEIYDEIWQRADNMKIGFDKSFEIKFQEPLTTLAWAAAAAWNLPDIFTEFLHSLTGKADPNDLEPVAEIVRQASDLSAQLGYGIEPWVETKCESDLNEAELKALKQAVDDYCAQAFGTANAA
ncbi:MAG: hypothetical protein BGO01_02820 [Armatimonadetes bacterium 55-13]|nr:HDOD domain-containing protein [Armatimonadota bacterium]OJU63595.1 MAG: hypothetical protein BGO01_02820 [Armatimonadetes bacterium 55-13]